jgi:hypothetical protein
MPVFRPYVRPQRPRNIAPLAQPASAQIVVDDSVSRFTGTPVNGSPITSSSFTPPNNSLLVVAVNGDTSGVGGAGSDITVSVSGGSLTWTNRVERDTGDGGGNRGHVSIFTAEVATGASMTVSVTRTAGDGGTNRLSAKVYIVTGYNVGDPVGAVGEGSTTATSNTPNAYTSTADNSRAFGAATDWGQNGNLSSSDVEDVADYVGAIAVISLYKASNTPTSGSSVTINFVTDGAGSSEWNWVALEIKPGAGGNPPEEYIATGAITPTGALALSVARNRAYAGTITPAGALSRAASMLRAYAGTITPAGLLARAVTRLRSFTATITPSGLLASTKVVVRAFTATITPAGALATLKALLRSFAGTITPAGALAKVASIARGYTATITPAGALNRAASFAKSLTATITPSGLFARAVSRVRAYAGTITPAGAFLGFKVIVRSFAATITPAGAFIKIAVKRFAGLITPAGALNRTASFVRVFAATVEPAGALFKTIFKKFTATITAVGAAIVGLFGVADRVNVAIDDRLETRVILNDRLMTQAAISDRIKTETAASDELGN